MFKALLTCVMQFLYGVIIGLIFFVPVALIMIVAEDFINDFVEKLQARKAKNKFEQDYYQYMNEM